MRTFSSYTFQCDVFESDILFDRDDRNNIVYKVRSGYK